MGAIASQITSLTIVYSIVYSDADQRKHQSSASLAFVRAQMASYAENVSIWWRHHVSGCSTGAVVIILLSHCQYNLTDMAKIDGILAQQTESHLIFPAIYCITLVKIGCFMKHWLPNDWHECTNGVKSCRTPNQLNLQYWQKCACQKAVTKDICGRTYISRQ